MCREKLSNPQTVLEARLYHPPGGADPLSAPSADLHPPPLPRVPRLSPGSPWLGPGQGGLCRHQAWARVGTDAPWGLKKPPATSVMDEVPVLSIWA